MLELQSFREKKVKRELEIVGILGFISVNVWKALFGERADSLERSTEHEDECTRSRLTLPRFSSLFFPVYRSRLLHLDCRHDQNKRRRAGE